jgi:hypothetical protein
MPPHRLGIAAAYCLTFLLCATAAGASASSLRLLVKGAWKIYYGASNHHQPICYATLQPFQSASTVRKKMPSYLFLTWRLADGAIEWSATSGFNYDADAAAVMVDHQKFKVLVKGDRLWMSDRDQDRLLLKAMEEGRNMTVRARSRVRTHATDLYRLQGIGQVTDWMRQHCPRLLQQKGNM